MFEGLRVVDLTTGIAGPYCTKLLADAGAEVVKVEPPEGDPMRRWSATGADLGSEDGALFRYLTTSKRSVVDDDVTLDELVAGAAVLVEDGSAPRVDLGALHAAHPSLVIVSISPFGLTGPWKDRPATEFTLQAWCGSTGSRGTPDRPPIAAGGRIGEWVAGTFASVAAVAAWRTARATGRGDHVDVSMFECMTVTMNTFTSVFRNFMGAPVAEVPLPMIELPSIEPTLDGYVGFCTIARQQFDDFLILIERPDLLADEKLPIAPLRNQRMDEFLGWVRAWTTTKTTAECIEAASLLRIPVSPVLDGATVVDHEQFVHRGTFVTNPHGFIQPRIPYRLGDRPRPGFRPAPALGEHAGQVDWPGGDRPTRSDGTTPGPMPGAKAGVATDAETPADAPEAEAGAGEATADAPGLPLAGIRIVDFTAFWAGPAATQVLAALGADVIKVESIQRPDGMRFTSVKPPSVDQWWEWGPVFHGANSNKRSVTLDLNRPEGHDLVLRLVAGADAVVENFSPRVMEQFGLGWDVIHATAPRAVMLRMPAFGLDGPWRDRTGFAQTMEQLTGMAAVTGYPDGPPVLPRGPVDPVAGMHAVLALLAALDQRDRTGEGLLVETTLAEAALNIAAEPVVEQSAYGRLITRTGNHGPSADPQGVFPARDGQWLALAAATDAHRSALAELLGGDPDEAAVASWCADQDATEAVDLLLATSVPAAVVINAGAVDVNEQHQARGFFQSLVHPVTGAQPLPSLPFRFASADPDGTTRGWLRSPPPTLGQHNDEVLRSVLGLDITAIERLRAEGIVGERPAGL